jgi:Uma2 family endonuclease
MAGNPRYDSPVEHGPDALTGSDSLESLSASFDLETLPDELRWTYELIDGDILLSLNPPSLRRTACTLMMTRLLWQDDSELLMLLAPFEYLPAPGYCLRPDIMMVELPFEADQVHEPPALVVEVLSPLTRPGDQKLRERAYLKFGVDHYWIVDPAGPSIRALRRRADKYVLVDKAGPGELFRVDSPLKLHIDPLMLLEA